MDAQYGQGYLFQRPVPLAPAQPQQPGLPQQSRLH
jgi:EAL domain-containing protein (putative c-di-GMP-specific phosphodiesterase class I)